MLKITDEVFKKVKELVEVNLALGENEKIIMSKDDKNVISLFVQVQAIHDKSKTYREVHTQYSTIADGIRLKAFEIINSVIKDTRKKTPEYFARNWFHGMTMVSMKDIPYV